jgi:hypothetical protein
MKELKKKREVYIIIAKLYPILWHRIRLGDFPGPIL